MFPRQYPCFQVNNRVSELTIIPWTVPGPSTDRISNHYPFFLSIVLSIIAFFLFVGCFEIIGIPPIAFKNRVFYRGFADRLILGPTGSSPWIPVFCCSNNLLNRFWIIWPQVIHFLFCFLLTFSVVFVDNFCFVDISVFVDTKCCHISGAIPCYTVLLLFDCPIEANDRFMVLRRDVIRLKKVTFASFLWFISYDSNNMLHEPLWRLLQNKLLGFLWRFFSD